MCMICSEPEPVRKDVTAYIADGLSNRQIAAKTGFNRMTVWRYRGCLQKQAQQAEALARDERMRERRERKEWLNAGVEWILNIVITYIEVDPRAVGNPAALVTESLIETARKEHIARGFPPNFAKAEPSAVPEPAPKLAAATSEPSPESEHIHQFRFVCASVKKCPCGQQEELPAQPVGVSRRAYMRTQEQRSTFCRGIFGRFG